jgi:hypothetical protein
MFEMINIELLAAAGVLSEEGSYDLAAKGLSG